MPEVKAGSVIEYKYVVKRRVAFLRDWYFQKNIPVRYSSVRFNYPEEFMFNPIFHTSLPYAYDTKTNWAEIGTDNDDERCARIPAGALCEL